MKQTIIISPKERQKSLVLFYLKGLVSGKFTLGQAAESTGLSKQWLCHLKKEYNKYGAYCLEHGNKNKTPVNKIPENLKLKIIGIYARPEYKDVNFSAFVEDLAEYWDIHISYTSIRRIMKEAGIRSPENHKAKHRKPVHRPRLRRENEGDLLQIDGTPFEWFTKSGDNNKYCMHGAIDDATGKITALYMTENECLYGVMKLIENTAKRYGLPREMYMDRAAWACVTPRNKQNLSIVEQLAGVHEKRTQIQRVLDELNIKQILAWSPQAKGRVERMWQTIQARYPLWAYHHKIKNMDDANKHMQEFIDYFNDKWAVLPKSDWTFWRDAPEDLDNILCAQFPRKTNINGCFKFHSYNFAVEGPLVACKDFILCITADGLWAKLDNQYYPVKLMDDDIGYTISDTMPQVVKNIIYDNLLQFAKEVSA